MYIIIMNVEPIILLSYNYIVSYLQESYILDMSGRVTHTKILRRGHNQTTKLNCCRAFISYLSKFPLSTSFLFTEVDCKISSKMFLKLHYVNFPLLHN